MTYDKTSIDSILEFAKELEDKSLRQACEIEIEKHEYGGKGNFGQLLEKYYFGYEPNSIAEPDFPDVGYELKSSPLKELKNGELRAKERLVLNIINYENVPQEIFIESSFWKKNSKLILVFYLYRKDEDVLDHIIKLVDKWTYPEEDLEIIKRDWETIKNKILQGKAHELSEGDTFYLGASTKGSTAAKSLRTQPNSLIKAKQRAYSLKQGYLNHIIANIAQDEKVKYGKLFKDIHPSLKSIEEYVIEKFEKYFGWKTKEIETHLNIELNSKAKNYFPSLSKGILDIDLNSKIEEFEKANIEFKSIRIQKNGKNKESISFPAFQFIDIYNGDWESSEMRELTEKKYLFVFFREIQGQYILSKVKFWNMPFEDRMEVKKVWMKTKEVITSGVIFKNYDRDKCGNIRYSKKGNPIRTNHFPKIRENRVCHVRPHGADSTKTYPLPIVEKTLGIMEYSKQCFWYNKAYILEEVYLK